MAEDKLRIEVSAAALEHNLRALRHATTTGSRPPASLLAVIKGNAYGHGAALCAPVLARAGAEWLGVTDAAEGVEVREALTHAAIPPDLQPGILVMCGLQPADAGRIAAHSLTPVVWFPEQLTWLEAAALTRATHAKAPEGATPDAPARLPIHLEIDTGMSRQGVSPGPALDRLLDHLKLNRHLRLAGLLTHFSSAEIAGSPITAEQARRFERAVEQIAAHGLTTDWLHAGNTATLDDGCLLPWLGEQATRLNARLLCRSGLALFGYALPIAGGAATLAPQLRPAATWKTRIIALSDIAPGEHVGYNATFTARDPMRLALLPVGYADGLRRELSGTDTHPGGSVLLRSAHAPIVGRVSMNLTTIDVTAIPEAGLGDEVTLLGPHLSAHEHARLAGTIPYEILCAMRGTRELVD